MSDITEILDSNYKPLQSIVVYGTAGVGRNPKYYLETHPVNDQGEVLAGKPLQQEDLNAIVDVFFDDRKEQFNVKGLLPENVLSFEVKPGGKYKMIWYRPAEIRVLHHAAQLKLATAKCWVPATLYVAEGRDLDVYALKTDDRPTEKTKLCIAPYFNVSPSGDVCLGSAKVKVPAQKTYTNLMKYWEDLFWLSEFTHSNGATVKSGDVAAIWNKLIASKTKIKWNAAELKETKKTLNNLL